MHQRTCQACNGRHVGSASQSSNKIGSVNARSISRPTPVRPGKQKGLPAVRSPVILSETLPPSLSTNLGDSFATAQTLPATLFNESMEPTTPLLTNIVLPCSSSPILVQPFHLPVSIPILSTTSLDNLPCNVAICEDSITEEPSDTILPCVDNGIAFEDYLFPELEIPSPTNTNHPDISGPHVSSETNSEAATDSPVISRSFGYRLLGNYFQVP